LQRRFEMPFSAALVMGGASLLGGVMGGNASRDAANTSARSFGASQFGFDPSGNLSSAGYTVSPELQAYQDRLMGLSERGLGQAEAGEAMLRPTLGAAQGLFKLGESYLSQTPEQVAQKYMASQYDLLAPSRERQMAQLENRLFNTGRGGLSVGGTGLRPGGGEGLRAASPEMEAYYNAIAQQDLQLATQAQSEGQRQVAVGAGLFGTGANLIGDYQRGQVGALSPFEAYLRATQGIEGLGQSSLDIGSQLGGRSAAAGANVGQFLSRGGQGAAETARYGNQYDPFAYALQGIGQNRQFGQGIENWMQGSRNTQGYGTGTRQYDVNANF
jgi:hypothetical protein